MAEARAAVVVVSGDVRAQLAPVPDVRTGTVGHVAGAARPAAPPALGGLGRRAAAAAEGLYLDAGDLWFPSYRVLPHRRADARAEAEAHAAALKRVGLAVSAVGEGDLAFGQDVLRELARAAGAQLVSANLVQAGTSSLAFAPYAVVSQGGLRVGVVGASPVLPADAPEADAYRFAGLEARAAGPAVAAAAAAARAAGAEVVVALLHMPEPEAQAVLRELPRGAVDAAVAAHGAGPGWFRVGLGVPTSRGRGVVRLAVGASGSAIAVQGAAVRLAGASLPGFEVEVARGAPEVVGAVACAETCHAEALQAWKKTAHARAMATLVGKKQGRNPDCMICHATGYAPGRALRPVEAEVSCEACHGSSAAHIADDEVPPEHGRVVSGWVCGGCHGVQAGQGVFHVGVKQDALRSPGHGIRAPSKN